LRSNCLLKHVVEGKIEEGIEVTGRQGRRRKQLLDDLEGNERILEIERGRTDRTLWITRCGRGYMELS
jgi:hypothetical protein